MLFSSPISISAPRFDLDYFATSGAIDCTLRYYTATIIVVAVKSNILAFVHEHASAPLARPLNLFLRLSAGLDYSHGS